MANTYYVNDLIQSQQITGVASSSWAMDSSADSPPTPLLHEPAQALDAQGQRHGDGDLEDEASWLSGNLLIPDAAGRHLACEMYGVGQEMLTRRLNMSGARKIPRQRRGR